MVEVTLTDLILVPVAIWYVTHLLMWEGGPWGSLDFIREKVFGVKVEFVSEKLPYHTIERFGFLADLIMCVYCFGFWVGIAIAALWYFVPLAAYAIGVVGLSVVLHHVIERIKYGAGTD